MKQYYFLIAAYFLLSPQLFAQNEAERKSCIKLNMLSPVMSTLNIAIETQTADDYTVQLGFAYMNHPTYANTNGLTKAFFLTPELRYQLGETKNGYAFIGVFGRYNNMEYTESERKFLVTRKATSNYQSIGGGIVIGQKLMYKSRVAIELFAGPVYFGIINSKNDFFNKSDDDIIIDQDIPFALLF
jgi:hypothetical protein